MIRSLIAIHYKQGKVVKESSQRELVEAERDRKLHNLAYLNK